MSRSQVPPQRAALELCTKLGSQTADPWRGVALVVLVVFFLCRQVCFKVHTHTQKKKRVVRECVMK